MRTLAAACAACIVAGCALAPRQEDTGVGVVRTPAPADYRATVTDYFDIMMPRASAPRRLAFGDPEQSDCALYGAGGRHRGWMVPVIADTAPATTAPVRGAGSAKRPAKGRIAASASASDTQAASVPPPPDDDGVATATLEEVLISGKGYFFWFSHDNIAAVTRRADRCPD